MKTPRYFPIVFSLLAIANSARATEQCNATGAPSMPLPVDAKDYAAFERQNFTGTIRCKDSELGSAITREEAYVKGKREGKSMITEGGKHTAIYRRGELNGMERWFREDGTVNFEEDFRNGRREGLRRTFFPSGRVSNVEFLDADQSQIVASVGYQENGRLGALQCGSVSVVPEDRKWCGFDGAVGKVDLYDEAGHIREVRRYEKGTRVKTAITLDAVNDTRTPEDLWLSLEKRQGELTILYPSGRVKAFLHFNQGEKTGVEKEFGETSFLKRQREWRDEKIVQETVYYDNGQPRSSEARSGPGLNILERKQYSDDGTLLRTEHLSGWDRQLRRDGHTLTYFPDGKVSLDEKFENGQRVHAISYDKDGKVIADEEYLEDGSRKSKTK